MTALDAANAATSDPAARPKRAILTLGNKGGSSKSFLARRIYELLTQTYTDGNLGIDGDSTVGHLTRFYGEHGGIISFNLHDQKTDERERLTDEILTAATAARVVIDMPATSLTILTNMASEGIHFAKSVSDAGYRLTVVAPITPYDDTIFDLQDAIALFDGDAKRTFEALADMHANETKLASEKKKLKTNADYVAVVNLGANAEDRDDFELWDSSDTRKLVTFLGGSEIEFPRLRSRIAAKIARHRDRFVAASTAEYLKPADRSRLTQWIATSERALREAGALLALD